MNHKLLHGLHRLDSSWRSFRPFSRHSEGAGDSKPDVILVLTSPKVPGNFSAFNVEPQHPQLNHKTI